MNSLSWLLYLSGAVENLTAFFAVLGTMGGIGCAFGAFISFMEEHEAFRAFRNGAIVCLVALFFATLVPSKDTVLLIAASEMGETVVKTPEAQEIFGDLKVILRQQLEALKK